MQVAKQLGLYDSTHLMKSEVPIVERNAVCSIQQARMGEKHSVYLQTFHLRLFFLWPITMFLLKISLWLDTEPSQILEAYSEDTRDYIT